jgi:putative aminopeptidase FrvX
MELKSILKEFMLTPAPAGYEKEMAYRQKAWFERYCDSVEIDLAGNVLGKIAGTQSGLPTAMVFGHMDSLGMIVRRIDDRGYIRVDRLGGVQEKVLPGLDVWVRSEDGRWHDGVIGPKAHHVTPPDEKYKVEPIGQLAIDIGASCKEEVNALGIHIGCPVVYKPRFIELLGSHVAGTAVDNRGACACLVGIAENLSRNRPACDVWLAATVQEEFNLRGGMIAARTVKPDLAIGLDVALAGDTIDLAGMFDARFGGGPCVQLYSFHGRGTLNGTLPHEPLFNLAKATAAEAGIPLQRTSSFGMLTDASYIQLEGKGVATLDMAFPARYTHTPVESCDVRDLEGLAALVSAMMRQISKDFQLARF